MLNRFFDIFCLIIVFQLSVFSVFLIQKRTSNKSNLILAVFFIAQALCILSSVITISNFSFFLENYPYLLNIGAAPPMLWGPLYYWYIKSVLKDNFRIKRWDILHLLPFVYAFFYYLINYQLNSPEGIRELVSKEEIVPQKIIFNIHIAQLIFYNVLTIIILGREKGRLKGIPGSEKRLFWARFFVYGYLSGCALSLVGFYLVKWMALWDYLMLFFTLSNFYFFVFFNMIFYKALVKPEIFRENVQISPKYKYSALSRVEENRYYEQINAYMKEYKPYLQQNLSLPELARLIGVPWRIISQVINRCENCNFSDFVNRYRIDHAKELLAENKGQKLNLLDILFASGFNSKTSFNTSFKKLTGLTPSEYKKQIGN